MMRRSGLALCLAAGMLGVLATGPVSAGESLTFRLVMFACPSGTGPANGSLKIEWYAASGQLKRTRTVAVGSFGDWFLLPAQCGNNRVEPGDILIAESTAPPLSHTFEVPLITGATDRNQDVVSGVAPANSSVAVRVDRNPLSSFGSQGWGPVTTPTSASGGYSIDLTGHAGSAGAPAYDAIGLDRVETRWTSPSGDTVTRQSKVPGVVVTIGSPIVTGTSTDFKLSTFSIRGPGGAIRGGGPAIASAFGAITGELQKASGAPLLARSGDRFSGDHAGASVSFSIPTLTIAYDLATDVVSGTCLPNVPYSIRAFFPNGFTTGAGITDASGSTAPFDTTSFNDLQSGDEVLLTCQKPSGDRIARRVAIP